MSKRTVNTGTKTNDTAANTSNTVSETVLEGNATTEAIEIPETKENPAVSADTEKTTNPTATKGTRATAAPVNKPAVAEPVAGESVEIQAMLSDIEESVGTLSGNPDSPSVTITHSTRELNLQPNHRIKCQSVFQGKLVYSNPTNNSRWVWNEYGAVQNVPLSVLEQMSNDKPVILSKPMIIIKDADVIDYFNLGDTYRKVADFNKLPNYFETNNVELIRGKIKGLIEVGMRDSLIADARKRRKENTLVNVNIINMLNQELKTDIG